MIWVFSWKSHEINKIFIQFRSAKSSTKRSKVSFLNSRKAQILMPSETNCNAQVIKLVFAYNYRTTITQVINRRVLWSFGWFRTRTQITVITWRDECRGHGGRSELAVQGNYCAITSRAINSSVLTAQLARFLVGISSTHDAYRSHCQRYPRRSSQWSTRSHNIARQVVVHHTSVRDTDGA